MSQTSLVETIQALGLLNAFEIGQLRRLDTVTDDRSLASRAVELGMLTDDGLARALAQQYRLNMVPEDRLSKLVIPPEVVSMLPRALMVESLILPTFFDAEKKILSLLTADPGDLKALREAQARSGSSRLRLFVAPRGPMRTLLERALPPEAPPELPAPAPTADRFLTLIWEPDAGVATLLAQLHTLEFHTVEVVSDLDHAEALIQGGQILRLLYRQAQEEGIRDRLAAWRRNHPRLLIGALPAWTALHAGSYPEARAAGLDRLDRLLPLLEPLSPEDRHRCRRTFQLCRRMVEEADLPPEAQDALIEAALLGELDPEGLSPEAAAVLAALDRRVEGREAPGAHPGAGLLYTARAAVRLGVLDGADPVAAFGDGAAGHDAAALRALQAVLARSPDQARPADQARVLLVEPDTTSALALEARLHAAGYAVTTLPDGEQAWQAIRAGSADALLCAMRVPRRDGLSLLMTLRRDPRSAGLPALLLSDTGSPPDIVRGLDLGADEVLPRATPPEIVAARLRSLLRRQPRHAPGISGRIQNMPLEDLLQSLCMGGRTTRVRVHAPDASGEIQIRSGEIVAADFAGRLEGVEALNALIELDQGAFEAFFEDGGRHNLSGNSSFLLLEAVRQRDERRG